MIYALLLLLAGCAEMEPFIVYRPLIADAQGYLWEPGGPEGVPEIHRGVDVYLHCGFQEGALDCAVQGRGDGKCHVYLPESPPPWLEDHGLKHCAGWRHPNGMLQFDRRKFDNRGTNTPEFVR